MRHIVRLTREMVRKSVQRDRACERYVAALSNYLWPWPEVWLLPIVALLAALDHLTTYAALEIGGNPHVYEGGLLASWALQRGGFSGLWLMDVVAVGMLCLLALGARSLYSRAGFRGFARMAYVVLLVPYAVAALAAVANNLVLATL